MATEDRMREADGEARVLEPRMLERGVQRSTIYDVARLAGVSPSTVSRALHQPGRIAPRTEQRVRNAAEALGYRTNPMARSLQTGRTGMVALVLTDATNPVYFDVLRGAERIAALHDLTIVFTESQEDAAAELEAANRIAQVCDGLVLVSSRLPDDQLGELAERAPVVLVNREVEGFASVTADPSDGVADVIDRLAALGHRSIVYLAGPESAWMDQRRRSEISRRTAERGIALAIMRASEPTMVGGSVALDGILQSGATAVIAFNDLVAVGVLRAARERGVDVPGRLSVIGFDDILAADLLALTTVRGALDELGAAALNALAELLAGAAPVAVRMPTALVPRASIGAAPARGSAWLD